MSDCATPWMAAHQAPPSLGFSRQEHWSGLPFPSAVHDSEKWKWSCSVVSDPQWPHGPQLSRLLRPWDFPGKSTGVTCHCLLRLDAFSHSTTGIASKISFPQFPMFFPPSLLLKKFEASVFSNSSFLCFFLLLILLKDIFLAFLYLLICYFSSLLCQAYCSLGY